jgi:hypothetical protein
MTVCLIASLLYGERWLGIALVASFFAPCFMLGIKMGEGDP